MSLSNTVNGRPQRKQLSEQLDRFDALLDGLSEGLNDSIADAVREGTRLALKDAVIEILTDPTLRCKLQQAAAPERTATDPIEPPRAGVFAGLKAMASAVARATTSAIASATAAVVRPAKKVASTVHQFTRLVPLFRNVKHLLYVGAGAALTIAVVSFLAPHVISTVLSGIGGGIAALAVQANLWTRRVARVAG